MGKNFFLLIISSLLLLAVAVAVRPPQLSPQAKAIEATGALHDTLQKHWEDQAILMQLFIVSTFSDLPDQEERLQELLQNQEDIGNAIKPYYGDAAGGQLTELLRQHILLMTEILHAVKSREQVAAEDAVRRWYANADEIAVFLYRLNRENWPLVETTATLREHLALTLQLARAEFTGDYVGSVAANQEVHQQALEIAAMLSNGIIRQFPEMFRGN